MTQKQAHTVREILDTQASLKTADSLSQTYGALKQIDSLLKSLVQAVGKSDHHEDDDWRLIYDTVFSQNSNDVGPQTYAALALSDLTFPDYYDPDVHRPFTSYEEDTRAWISALEYLITEIESSQSQSVRDILENHKTLAESIDPRNQTQTELKKIALLLKRLVQAVDQSSSHKDDDFELIYDSIFSKNPADIGPRTKAALALSQRAFPDYYDPDTSYEDDVFAWIRAFDHMMADDGLHGVLM